MSNNKQKPVRTPEEIYSELKKSNLKTQKYVFVEGIDDVIIYQNIINRKDMAGFLFEEVRGRKNLFKLNELIRNNPLLVSKTMLLADKDTYVFAFAIPSEHENIRFTKGYSIENDLFEDGYDFLMNDLSQSEKTRFDRLINNISEWYAYEIEKVLAGKGGSSKTDINLNHPDYIAPGSEQLNAEFLEKRGYSRADKELCDRIKNNYKLLLRGKFLFEVLHRISHESDKKMHHKGIPFFWSVSITKGFEIAESNCKKIVSIFENKIGNP